MKRRNRKKIPTRFHTASRILANVLDQELAARRDLATAHEAWTKCKIPPPKNLRINYTIRAVNSAHEALLTLGPAARTNDGDVFRRCLLLCATSIVRALAFAEVEVGMTDVTEEAVARFRQHLESNIPALPGGDLVDTDARDFLSYLETDTQTLGDGLVARGCTAHFDPGIVDAEANAETLYELVAELVPKLARTQAILVERANPSHRDSPQN